MSDITLIPLRESDFDEIVSSFKQIGWNKPISIYENYLNEQLAGVRSVIVAKHDGKFCGYITLKWQPDYPFFIEKNIPEIADLNVLPGYRKQGIGTQLIQACENLVKEQGRVVIGIGVGLIADYGNAQRLYIQLGYLPDGKGLHYEDRSINYAENVIANDDLVIYLTKQLDVKQIHSVKKIMNIATKDRALSDLLSLEKDAREFGFEWPNQAMIIEQAIDECREIKDAIEKQETRDRIQEEMGDLLHSIISLCDFEGFSVEDTLAKVNTKFSRRMQAVKRLTHDVGLPNLKGQSFEYMLELWRKAKIMTDK